MTSLITSEYPYFLFQFISRKKIGILGGMFNPPTNAHMQVTNFSLISIFYLINNIFLTKMAIEAINLGFVHEVWFVPSGNDPLN